MISRTEGYFKGYNDFELFYQAWIPEQVDSTLVVTHGLGEHSECYNRLAEAVTALPVEVYTWDLRGHGRSEGKRGVVRSLSDYCEDLLSFLEQIKKCKRGKKTFLLGHSMGGLVNSLTLIKKGGLGLSGVCFSSPLMGIAVEVPKFKKKAATYISEWLPNITLFNEIAHKELSQDKDVLYEYGRDPLRHDRINPQLFLDMLQYTDYVRKNADKIVLPVLVQQAGHDKVVSVRDTREFFERLGSPDKSYKEYEHSFHEIFNDVERKKVFNELNEWLTQHMKEKAYEAGTH